MIGKRIDISEIEVALILSKFSWSFLLIFSSSSLDNSPAYAPMLDVASAQTWGVISLFVNIVVVIGALTHRRWVQIVGLTFATTWWAGISAMFYVTESVPTGIAVYAVLSGCALWRVFARISGYSDALYVYRNGTLPSDVRRRKADGQDKP